VIGRTLDRYSIVAKLGEGGMGVVYRARDTHLDRTVAIKVLPPDKVSDPERTQRFMREAKAASALNHPNIVTVHDIRSDSGVDFIVMEYIDGRTLDQVIPPKGLAVATALRYAIQIADALARAHEAGIVHRDLKPSNVIVTNDERIKLLDFGIAKLLERADGTADASTKTTPLTDEGIVIGTAAYMSPEQAEGRRIDARSDVFSFGALLYEMVTGRTPFRGNSALSVLSAILNEDPPSPSLLAPTVSPDVDRLILRCLRKDPARRYQTMADLKVALDDLAASDSGSPAQTRTFRRARGRRWVWAAVIPVALAVVAYAGWQSFRRPPPAPALRAVPLAALPGGVRSPSFSPDGNQIAFTWSGPKQDNVDVYVQQIGAGAPLRLTTDAANDYSPAWAPDGRSIAFLRQRDGGRHELRLVPPLGGPESRVTDIQPRGFLRPVTLAWCPDSTCVVLTDAPSSDDTKADALFVVSIESGEKRQLTTSDTPLLADTDPAISPDGRWLVFRRDVAPFSGHLQLVQLDDKLTVTGAPRVLTPILQTAYGPQWISDREIIFSAKASLWRMDVVAGSAAERLPFVGEDGEMPAVSRAQPGGASRLAYVRRFIDMNIWRIDTPTAGARAVTAPAIAIASTRRDSLAQLSPDGRKVAFISDRSGESEVWLADASGANAVQLTSLGAIPGYPRWSPDGTSIAFHSNAEDRPQGALFVVSAERGHVRRLTSHPATEVFASYSRDGRWLYFSSRRGGGTFIWKMPVSGGEPTKVSPTAGLLAVESTDGASLFYGEIALSTGWAPLVQMPVNGGEPVKIVDRANPLSFDVVEGGIYYMEQPAGNGRLQYFDLRTRQATVVAENLGSVGLGLSASRDGRTILYSRVDSSVNDLMLVENFR